MHSEATWGYFLESPNSFEIKNAWKVMVFHFCYSEAIRSLESENEELMKDNTLAGSIQNQNQVLTLGRQLIYDRLAKLEM